MGDALGLWLVGHSRAQWRFGIFAVGLQMAIKLNQVKSSYKSSVNFYVL